MRTLKNVRPGAGRGSKPATPTIDQTEDIAWYLAHMENLSAPAGNTAARGDFDWTT